MSAPEGQQTWLPFSREDEVQMLRDSNTHLEVEIAALREENARLRQQLFGKKTERLVDAVFDIEVEESPEETPKSKETDDKPNGAKGAPRRTRRLHIRYRKEIEEERFPEEVQQNPAAYKRLPKENDVVVHRVEQVPAHLVLHTYRCPRFVKIGARGKSAKHAPIFAKAPGTILPGSNIGSSIIATAVHQKYTLHLPLYRQIKEFERIGLGGLSEGVMCNWMRAAADALEPLWRAMHEQLLDSKALHVDETPVRCLKSDKTNGYMWAMSSADDGMNLYYWQNSRSGQVLDSLLRRNAATTGEVYSGVLLSDGYTGYESWMATLPEAQRPRWQMCWAHVRRKFVEAAANSNDPQWSRRIVALIRPLYTLERELRESKAPPEEILQRRRVESRPIVEKFFEELQTRAKNSQTPPLNKLKAAIDYALKRRETLVNWLDDPFIPIDNNQVERAIRPVTVGRKNSLFIGAPEAGQRAAILYTMMEECKRVNVDTLSWLTKVLRTLPSYRGDYLDLLPGVMPLDNEGQYKQTRI